MAPPCRVATEPKRETGTRPLAGEVRLVSLVGGFEEDPKEDVVQPPRLSTAEQDGAGETIGLLTTTALPQVEAVAPRVIRGGVRN